MAMDSSESLITQYCQSLVAAREELAAVEARARVLTTEINFLQNKIDTLSGPSGPSVSVFKVMRDETANLERLTKCLLESVACRSTEDGNGALHAATAANDSSSEDNDDHGDFNDEDLVRNLR